MLENDFWLLPDGLDEQAGVIDEWAAEFARMNDALVPIVLTSEAGAALHGYAIGKAGAMHTGLLQWFAHLQNVLHGVSAELRDVAAEGRRIDLDAAVRIDAFDPTEYNDFDPYDGGHAPFGRWTTEDRVAPSWDRYDEPDAPAPSPDIPDMGLYLDAGPAFEGADEFTERLFPEDLLSPTGWVRTIMEQVGALSFRQQIFNGFGGHWGTLRDYAFKLNGIGLFLETVHDALSSTFARIGRYWQGYAANSAAAYFEVLLDGLWSASRSSKLASQELDKFSDSVKQAADIIGGEIEGFHDTVLFAAAAAAFGATLSETIIGGMLGGGLAAVSVARATSLWLEIRDAVQDMESLQSIVDTIGGLGADLGDFTSKLGIPLMVETS